MGFFDMFRAFGGEELPDVPEIEGSEPDLVAFGAPPQVRGILAEAIPESESSFLFRREGTITKAQALQIPTVEAALGLISGVMRRLPIRLYKRQNGETREIADDRRTFLLNTNNSSTLTPGDMLAAMIEDYFLFGGAYTYIRRRGNNADGLFYVENREVCVLDNNEPIFKDYDISVRGERFFPFDFLKVLRNSKNGATGEGLLKRGSLLSQVIYNTMKFENNMVSRGGNKKGFVKSEKKLAPDAMKTLKDDMRGLYSNSDENLVVFNSGLDFKEISASSVELQLAENKKNNNLEICKLFGIPEGLLTGCGTSAASEDDKIKFTDFCIKPLCAVFEGALNRDLLTLEEQKTMFFRFDTDELSKGKLFERMQAYAIALKNNIYLLDEIRQKENMRKLSHDSLNLNLGSVLYNPKTQQGFVPNTGEQFDMSAVFGDEKKGAKQDEG